MLLRLPYLALTSMFTLIRLMPMSDSDKNVEILTLRHLRGSKTPSPWLTWTDAALGHAVGHHHYVCRYA